MFLGYAILQLPDFVLSIKNMFRSVFTNKVGLENNENSTNNKINENLQNESNDIGSKANKMEKDIIILKRKVCQLSENK